MALQLEECGPADFSRAFEIISLAFAWNHPYFNAVFPNHDSKKGRSDGSDRLKAMVENDKYSHFWKVTDSTTNRIIGVSKWIVFDEGIVPEEVELDGPYWDDVDVDKGFAQAIFSAYMAPRRRAIRESGGNLVSLDLMAVDPAEQRRGVGGLLMRPGVEQADRLGVKASFSKMRSPPDQGLTSIQAVVEASHEGRGLYEKSGFKVLEFVEVKVPEPYDREPKQVFYWMERKTTN